MTHVLTGSVVALHSLVVMQLQASGKPEGKMDGYYHEPESGTVGFFDTVGRNPHSADGLLCGVL